MPSVAILLVQHFSPLPLLGETCYTILSILFSSELGNLTNLRDLNVMNNKLEWLPWQLCKCSSLEILSFDGNAVQKIPRQLMRHQGLTELYASGNNISTLPQGKFETLTNSVSTSRVVISDTERQF